MLKKNWYLFTPLILVLAPVAVYLYYSAVLGYGSEDAIRATKYFAVSGTRYPMQFSEENFARLKPGMDGRQVFETMGKQPVERHDNDTRWLYSLPAPGKKAYHERTVILERDAQNVPRVKNVLRRFQAPEE